jgi:hypothetical protein
VPKTPPRTGYDVLERTGWWGLFCVVVVYGLFSIQMGVSELMFLLGIGSEIKHRAAPTVFVVHALSGALCLFIGPMQSMRWVRRTPGLRGTLGRAYVLAVWIASVSAVLDVGSFDVSVAAKIIFALTAALWFATTTMGMVHARARRHTERHDWMVRSYSLSLFVVSFSVWVPVLASTSLPPSLSYPLGLFLAAALNLAAAEIWIRRHRARRAFFPGEAFASV